MKRFAAVALLAVVPFVTGFQYRLPQSAYPVYQPGYPGYQPGAFGDEPQFIRALYNRFLQREPDPQGLNTWLTRLVQFGGNRQRLAQEFQQAAQLEQNANNPYYPRFNNPNANPYSNPYGPNPYGPNW